MPHKRSYRKKLEKWKRWREQSRREAIRRQILNTSYHDETLREFVVHKRTFWHNTKRFPHLTNIDYPVYLGEVLIDNRQRGTFQRKKYV